MCIRDRVEQEPERADLRHDLALCLIRVGDLYSALGSPDRARNHYEEALTTDEGLLAREPERADVRRNLVALVQRMARVDPENVVTWSNQAIDLLRARLAIEPNDIIAQRDLAIALLMLVQALGSQAEPTRIATLRGEALELLQDLHGRGSLEARYQPVLERLAEAKG